MANNHVFPESYMCKKVVYIVSSHFLLLALVDHVHAALPGINKALAFILLVVILRQAPLDVACQF